MYLAYLDPGTGSYLAAAIVGGFAGTMVAVKTWGRRILGRFHRQPVAEGPDSPTPRSSGPETVTNQDS